MQDPEHFPQHFPLTRPTPANYLLLVKLRPHGVLSFLVAGATLGCSGGTSPPAATSTTTTTTAPTSALLTVPGNWQMELESTAVGGNQLIANFDGALSVSGSAVTGIFRLPLASATPCFPPTQDILFTGSLDSGNLLTLTSAPFAGSVAVLTLQLPVNAANIAHGTATITGGACSLATSSVLGVFVPSVTGTYVGTAAPNTVLGQTPSVGGSVNLILAQGPENTDGQFPVTGSLAFNSPTCTISTDLAGTVTGLDLNITQTPGLALNSVILLPLLGPLTSPTATRLINFIVPSATATCAAGNYTGQLTPQ